MLLAIPSAVLLVYKTTPFSIPLVPIFTLVPAGGWRTRRNGVTGSDLVLNYGCPLELSLLTWRKHLPGRWSILARPSLSNALPRALHLRTLPRRWTGHLCSSLPKSSAISSASNKTANRWRWLSSTSATSASKTAAITRSGLDWAVSFNLFINLGRHFSAWQRTRSDGQNIRPSIRWTRPATPASTVARPVNTADFLPVSRSRSTS